MAELSLMIGLGLVIWLGVKLAKDFENSDSGFNQFIFTTSLYFLAAMMYTGYGIAEETVYTEAQVAYLLASIFTTFLAIGFTLRLYSSYREKTENQSELDGLT